MGRVDCVVAAIAEINGTYSNHEHPLNFQQIWDGDGKHQQSGINNGWDDLKRKPVEHDAKEEPAKAIEKSPSTADVSQEGVASDFGKAILFVIEGDEDAKRDREKQS